MKKANFFSAKNLMLITQKAYLFRDSNSSYTAIGTESVRGCYAITLFHKNKQCMIHWDDNTKRTQLPLIVDNFLKDLDAKQCVVNLAGGWHDHIESAATGEFLKTFFQEKQLKITLDGYQVKSQHGRNLDAQGFDYIVLDCIKGKLHLSANWNRQRIKGQYHKNAQDILNAGMYLDKTHYQKNDFPDSGSSLINPETFEKDKYKGAMRLCKAARDNDITALIAQIDDGITDVNTPAKNAKGWAPLHYACKAGNFECAKILIKNGANINQKTDSQKTPLHLIEGNTEEIEKLILLSVIINKSFGDKSQYSIFSRHPERVQAEYRERVKKIEAMLENPEERTTLRQGLFK